MNAGALLDRTGLRYRVIKHPVRRYQLPDGSQFVRTPVTLESPGRDIRRAYRVSGRQWTRMRKAARRAAYAAYRQSEGA